MPRQSKDQVLYDMHNHGVNLNLRDIYLHSYYTKEEEDEPGVDYRQATTFIKNLHMLDQPPNKPILVHLQSVGGDWDNGMAMFNTMTYATAYITVLAYSQASSMSGVIFQAASLRIMMPDCHFLMHHGSSGGGVNHPFAIKTAADFEYKACKRMLSIFAERAYNTGPFFTKKKSTTVQSAWNFFDRKLKEKIDWYLDSEEAVYYGLADDILGGEDYPNIKSLREE
jgi:ATP-dependent protease ClpP protease subunit